MSILHPEVCGGDLTGLLAVHSLSKRSNMAGYRAGFVSGDPALVAVADRRCAGTSGAMVPLPVQAAAPAALDDDAHVLAQRAGTPTAAGRSAWRRSTAPASQVGHSEAGLYLWCTRGEPAMRTGRLARRARHPGRPGHLLRARRAQHVRIALTATDEHVAAVAERLERRGRR